jgi:hypothetical protein
VQLMTVVGPPPLMAPPREEALLLAERSQICVN